MIHKSWADSLEKSFLANFYTGKVNYDIFSSFPQSDIDKESETARILARDLVQSSCRESAHSCQISQIFLEEVRKTKLLAMNVPVEHGGMGMNNTSTYAVMCEAASIDIPSTLVIGISNGFGIGSILPVITNENLREIIIDRVQSGCISGWADTEPQGAANWMPNTTASLSHCGNHYSISGEKRYIGNGSIADCLLVSAAESTSEERGNLFIVDTHAEGFHSITDHEFMGLERAPISAISLDKVSIPVDHKIVFGEDHWRNTPLIEPISCLGRMLSVVAVNESIAERCVKWMDEFSTNKIINGRQLGNYGHIADLISLSKAELFALKSMAKWILATSDRGSLIDCFWEMIAAKNFATETSRNISDRCMSIFGAEGFETAKSKSLLGYGNFPVEQAYRDCRGFRISGGVDFAIDFFAAKRWISIFYYQLRDAKNKRSGTSNIEYSHPVIDYCEKQTERIFSFVSSLTDDKLEIVLEHQSVLILLNKICRRVFAIAVSHSSSKHIYPNSSSLADLYYEHARTKIESYWMNIERKHLK